MFELDMVDTLENIGFDVLIADKPGDIEKWPPFNSLFALPILYDIKDEITDEVLVADLDFTTTVKIIKLFDADPIEGRDRNTFVEDFLSDEGYFCFTNYDGRALIALEQ